MWRYLHTEYFVVNRFFSAYYHSMKKVTVRRCKILDNKQVFASAFEAYLIFETITAALVMMIPQKIDEECHALAICRKEAASHHNDSIYIYDENTGLGNTPSININHER